VDDEDYGEHEIAEKSQYLTQKAAPRDLCFNIFTFAVGFISLLGMVITCYVLAPILYDAYYYFIDAIYAIFTLLYLIILVKLTNAVSNLDKDDIHSAREQSQNKMQFLLFFISFASRVVIFPILIHYFG
jgi:Ca2+/Na+ antiporter